MTRRVYFSRPALINALGRDSASVAQALFAGRVEGMVTEFGHLPFAPQRPVRVGRVADGLPTLPSGFVHHESRNNRLLLAAANASIRYAKELTDDAISYWHKASKATDLLQAQNYDSATLEALQQELQILQHRIKSRAA